MRVATSGEERPPADVVGTLVLVTIIVFAVTAVLNLLGFEALGALVSEFLVFAGHVLLGVVIFALGLYLANLAARTIQTGGVTQDSLLALASQRPF